MGCLNSQGQFSHWFANIHLSGPCNRACTFCIGQHMPGVDPINNLDTWPLLNFDKFIQACRDKGVKEVNLTGSDTDPLLYNHLPKLIKQLRKEIPDVRIGMRTNGVLVRKNGMTHHAWHLLDKASISITSLNPVLYKKTMGRGTPPSLEGILNISGHLDIKVNIVLTPETLEKADLFSTILHCAALGIKRINVREPYGQPHIGNPFVGVLEQAGEIFGMPQYIINDTIITYWDVHYVEVESVNLYANGEVSLTYPVTKGHDPVLGKVVDQTHFSSPGRQYEQWKNKTKLVVVR